MFHKGVYVSLVLFSLTLQGHAHGIVSPPLGVQGTPSRSDVQRPSGNKPCGNINPATTIDNSQTVTPDAQGNVHLQVTNFNGGADGSRKVTAQVSPDGTLKNMTNVDVTTNGDATPTNVGSQPLVVNMPSDIKCTGGKDNNLCLMAFKTTSGFGNCVAVKQGNGANAGNGNSGSGNGNSGSGDVNSGSGNGNDTANAVSNTKNTAVNGNETSSHNHQGNKGGNKGKGNKGKGQNGKGNGRKNKGNGDGKGKMGMNAGTGNNGTETAGTNHKATHKHKNNKVMGGNAHKNHTQASSNNNNNNNNNNNSTTADAGTNGNNGNNNNAVNGNASTNNNNNNTTADAGTNDNTNNNNNNNAVNGNAVTGQNKRSTQAAGARAVRSILSSGQPVVKRSGYFSWIWA